jgi:hypothetical protein
MADKKEQYDNEFSPQIPERLKNDLNALFKPKLPILAEADRAILDRAFQLLLYRHQRRRRIFQWVGSAAAAAAIIICLSIFLNHATPQADIDHNGRVNILDAFALARQIETTDTPDKKWDINKDGLVNQADVDTVALVAVELNKGIL